MAGSGGRSGCDATPRQRAVREISLSLHAVLHCRSAGLMHAPCGLRYVVPRPGPHLLWRPVVRAQRDGVTQLAERRPKPASRLMDTRCSASVSLSSASPGEEKGEEGGVRWLPTF